MSKTVSLIIEGKEYILPVIIGSEGEKAIDIRSLRKDTGYITLDSGLANSGSCLSEITFLDGENGVLRYRGYPIEELAENTSFIEVAYLLIYNHLPNIKELEKFSADLTRNSMLHEDMKNFFNGYPPNAHPMLVLSAMVASLCSYYPELADPEPSKKSFDMVAVELISKVRTISAFSYKKSKGEPMIYPIAKHRYITNFLHMMFSSPREDYVIDPDVVKALEVLFILHADHEQNCSTSTVRMVGSAKANLFTSISAGISALWGPLHGGANQKVVEMLMIIEKDHRDVDKYINMAKDKNFPFRLMGFGHRVYKNYDPRATIIKKYAHKLLSKSNGADPLLEIAYELEEKALSDPYFAERQLYPNVDFYSGLIYRAIGIPINMFPVMFAIARIPGWIANWKEMVEDKDSRIFRPRQIYTGEKQRSFLPLDQRPA